MHKWTLDDYLDAYIIGVYPEWNDAVLEQETISRSVYDRDYLYNNWDKLTEGQIGLVLGADIAIIKHAKKINEWCNYDGLWEKRDKMKPPPPLKKWWWYLDRIVAGVYPLELLPEYLVAVADFIKPI